MFKKAAALIRKIKAAHRKPEPAQPRPEYIFIHDDQENLLKLIDHLLDMLNRNNITRPVMESELITLRCVLSEVDRNNICKVISAVCDKKEGSDNA